MIFFYTYYWPTMTVGDVVTVRRRVGLSTPSRSMTRTPPRMSATPSKGHLLYFSFSSVYDMASATTTGTQ